MTVSGPGRQRILHVVWDFSRGGLERLVHDLAVGMDPVKWETHVLSLGGTGEFAEGLDGVAEVHVAGRMSRFSLIAPLKLARILRSIRPDLVHTHSGIWYKTAKAAQWAGVPRLLHTDHGRTPQTRLGLTLERLAARRTDMVVAVSQGVLEFHLHELGTSPNRIVKVLNGIDSDRFKVRGLADHRPKFLPATRPLIGSVGRFDPIKGYDVALRAFAEVRREPGMESSTLVLVGDGPERQRLESDARALAVRDHVVFTGWVADVEAILPWLDVFTLSSYSEGTSLSLLEAMSCGICPVVTAVGGNSDVLGADLRHRLVKAGDPRALAQGWSRALRDSATRAADGVAARSRVVELFGLRAMVRRYEELYENLLEGTAGVSA